MKHQISNISILKRFINDVNAGSEYEYAYNEQGDVIGLHIFGNVNLGQRILFNIINTELVHNLTFCDIYKQLRVDCCTTASDWQELGIIPPTSSKRFSILIYINEYVYEGDEVSPYLFPERVYIN